jgi:hypothetical protein
VIPQVLTKEFPAIAVVEALYKVAPLQAVQVVEALLKNPEAQTTSVAAVATSTLTKTAVPAVPAVA